MSRLPFVSGVLQLPVFLKMAQIGPISSDARFFHYEASTRCEHMGWELRSTLFAGVLDFGVPGSFFDF